jgi:hypothetical protein
VVKKTIAPVGTPAGWGGVVHAPAPFRYVFALPLRFTGPTVPMPRLVLAADAVLAPVPPSATGMIATVEGSPPVDFT